MSAAVDTLVEEAERLRNLLDREKEALTAHRRGALQKARENFTEQQRYESEKIARIDAAQSSLTEVLRGIETLQHVATEAGT